MFAHLLLPFREALPGLGLLGSITARAGIAFGAAFGIGVLLGPRLIRWLRTRRIGERADCTDSDRLNVLHADKSDTPTMGGVGITVAAVVAGLLLARWDVPHTWLVLGGLGLFGGLGGIDDWVKLRGGQGLSARWKMRAQVLLALVLLGGFLLVEAPERLHLEEVLAHRDAGAATGEVVRHEGLTRVSPEVAAGAEETLPPPNRVRPGELYLPFLRDASLPVGGLALLLLGVLVVVGTSNAVNLTDGLDGLAGGTFLMTGSVLCVYAYVAGRTDWSLYLGVPWVPGAGEVAVCLAGLLGATLAFLWYNCHPAQVFMGDAGSLPLGAALGLAAVATRQELALVVVGGVFVLEAGSVILQVAWYKLTGRRVLRCAPLHHHFQFAGWPESKIVARFWILAALFAGAGLLLLKVR